MYNARYCIRRQSPAHPILGRMPLDDDLPDLPLPERQRDGAEPDEDDADPDFAFIGEDDYLDDDDAFPLGTGVAETSAEVWCPYCGEQSEITVDPGGGDLQRYVEDCPVCCRPWQVTVHFATDGSVSVAAEVDDAHGGDEIDYDLD